MPDAHHQISTRGEPTFETLLAITGKVGVRLGATGGFDELHEISIGAPELVAEEWVMQLAKSHHRI